MCVCVCNFAILLSLHQAGAVSLEKCWMENTRGKYYAQKRACRSEEEESGGGRRRSLAAGQFIADCITGPPHPHTAPPTTKQFVSFVLEGKERVCAYHPAGREKSESKTVLHRAGTREPVPHAGGKKGAGRKKAWKGKQHQFSVRESEKSTQSRRCRRCTIKQFCTARNILCAAWPSCPTRRLMMVALFHPLLPPKALLFPHPCC